jgi:gamma-glutamyltranspeptidase
MRQTLDSGWRRRGTSWIWDEEARNLVCTAPEVWSLRQFLQAVGHWADDLPSNNGDTLVVAGLDGSLDLLSPKDAEIWLADVIKPAVLSFQSFYEGQAALVFWMPSARERLKTNPATDAVTWLCEAPHRGSQLDFGRILWGEANEYPQEILLREGAKPAGLFHLRIT